MKRLILLGGLSIMLLFSCSSDDTPRCELFPRAGRCDAAIPRYYFDQEEQKCKEFLWGGCDGVVPFETLEACQECE